LRKEEIMSEDLEENVAFEGLGQVGVVRREDIPPPVPPTPRIVQVEYRRLVTFGRYENETIGCVAEVPSGGSAGDVLDGLKVWVGQRLNCNDEVRSEKYEVERLRHEQGQIQEEIDACKAQWEKARSFLEKHGVSLPEDDPMPF
jgi:hypothetical protein